MSLAPHDDIKRYGGPVAAKLQAKLVAYLDVVIREDWDPDDPAIKSQELFVELEGDVVDLQAGNRRLRVLQDRMLADLDDLSDHRVTRLLAAPFRLYWVLIVAVITFAVSAVLLSAYPPTLVVQGFLALYAALVGLILYSIVDLGDPFRGVAVVSSEPLVVVREYITS